MGFFNHDPYRDMRISTADKYGRYMNLLWHPGQGNIFKTIISGGDVDGRNRVLISLIKMAWGQGNGSGALPMPMIILHVNNGQLHQTLCRGVENAVIRGEGSFPMDPLVGIDKPGDAASILYNACNAASPNGKPAARLREAFKIGAELIFMQGGRLSISALHELPWSSVSDYIEQLADRGQLSQEEAMHLISRAGNVQDELYTAEDYIHELNGQFTFDGRDERTIGLLETINRSGRVCVNLRSNSNSAIRELFSELIKSKIAGSGRQFLLILDSVNIKEGDSLWNLTTGDCCGYSCILTGSDIPGMMGDNFRAFAAGSTNVIAFSHPSGTSSNALADHIGKTYQIKVTHSDGTSRETTKIIGSQRTHTTTADEELRHIIPSSFIQTLPCGAAVTVAAGGSGIPYIVDFMTVFNQLAERMNKEKLQSASRAQLKE